MSQETKTTRQEISQEVAHDFLRVLKFVADESTRANGTIALNRDGGGQGRVGVATAMHRIEREARAAIARANTTRLRKNQDVTRWPPSMNQDDIEQAIDDLCGCKGRWDCDCVSVFNKACGDAWYEHNTGEKP